MKLKEKVLKEPVTDEEHGDFIKLFEDEFNHPMEIPSEFTRMVAFSRYRIQKKLAEVGKKHLEDLYELINNLEDDLELDLKEGESGYKTHKESYNAVKKYTLKVLKKKIRELRKSLGIK